MVNATSTRPRTSSEPAGAPDPVLFENVAAGYPGRGHVLKDVTLKVGPGSLQFLTGASGSGKTTLIRLILLSLRPSSGRAVLFGEDVAAAGPDHVTRLRRRMGAVFQDFRLIDHLSVYENVALPFRVRGRAESSYRAEVNELLDWVGLRPRADSPPRVLSGGEQQRAAIARAVITRPDLILADEPTGNVDPHLARRLLHLFAELNRSGTAVLLATHDAALMKELPARRLLLADGRVIPHEPSA